MKKSILFICTHNSARSQMAEGLINHYYSEYFQARSAGTVPTKVNPYAIAVMKELGIDISHHRSKPIEEFRGQVFDIVVTVCDDARERCPFFPGGMLLHKSFEDPSRTTGTDYELLDVFRRIRDEIKEWIESELVRIFSSRADEELKI